MIIEKQNYDLIIGTIPPWWKKVRYVFDGWNNTQKQKDFHNSLSFFASEVYANRVTPVSKISQSIMKIVCWGSAIHIKNIPKTIKHANPNGEPTEPPLNTIIDITYNKNIASIEEIENFILNCGINIHRAEPFIKPNKTLWQLIKEKI